MRSISLSAALTLVLLAGCPIGGEQPSPDPGKKLDGLCIPAGTEVALVVESSGRMAQPALAAPTANNSPTKWGLTLDAGKRATQWMKPIDRTILSFPADQAEACVGEGCGWDWMAWYHDRAVFKGADWYWKHGRDVAKDCDVGDPQIDFGEAPGQYVSGLEHVNIGGGSPVADALLSAYNAILQRNPAGNSRHIFLVADGADTCGGDAARMVKKLHGQGIDVWVIGFETSDAAALNELAELGGHPQPGAQKFFLLNDRDDLLETIRAALSGIGAEICDGVDNDCDGQVDETLTRPCALACGGGTQTCKGGVWGACEGGEQGFMAVEWLPERCDGQDDNCDGDLDEQYTLGAVCQAATGTCVALGHTVCAADGSGAVCDAVAPIAGVEVCNGQDDDCDGQVDEGVNLACTTACGKGHQACTDGFLSECVIEVFNIDLCNGVDDDCDGQVDEGFNVGGTCSKGIGTCETQGTVVCAPDGLEAACDAPAPLVSPEVCNGLDDDCNGKVDDGNLCPKGQICYNGQCVFD